MNKTGDCPGPTQGDGLQKCMDIGMRS